VIEISAQQKTILLLKIGENNWRSVPGEGETTEPVRKTHGTAAVVIAALVLVAGFVFLMPNAPALVKEGSGLFSQLISSLEGRNGGNGGLNYTIYSPLIQKGAANISYPSNYDVLADYALGLINNDRTGYGLAAVTLSDVNVAQQHADSMLRYGYFSHNDTQGFKPYMRYTLLGGRGAVEENIATSYANYPDFTSTASVEAALKTLEYTMMYNDSQCCNNGHRYNILSSLHNRVSIGVAFNSTRVFFVEDFENYYVDFNFSVSSSYTVTMSGTPLEAGLTGSAVYVYYDSTPTPETPAQLNAGPHEYGSGASLGGVLPPCYLTCSTFEHGITAYAGEWTFTSTSVAVSFSLHDFIQRYGPGVYTLYLLTSADPSSDITSFCVFVG